AAADWRGLAQRLPLDPRNRPVRRRGSDRREGRSKNEGHEQADRQDREALPAREETSFESAAGSAFKEAALPARSLRSASDPRRDVEPRPQARFQPAREEAAGRQDS